MKFTKRQRHSIYKATLKHYKELVVQNEQRGICYSLSKVVREKYPDIRNVIEITYSDHDISFPELHSQKPKKEYNKYYWFSTSKGINKRIEILKNCINQTK